MTPTFRWDWPHLRSIQSALERVTYGETKRLMVFMPPRSGKSEMTTIRYPVWRLEHDPTIRIIVGSYNQFFAERFGRRSRRIAEERFPLSGDRKAVCEWETLEGGVYRSVGVGSGVTGQGADLIVIDDPVKNRDEAESETYRERLWDWFRDDLWTRQEPSCAMVLTMTRWHVDDLAGRLLKAAEAGEGEPWEVLSLPALAEEADPLGREPGEALCPERFSRQDYEKARTVLGKHSFECLYQQRPGEREGNLFKRGWLPIVDASPAQAQRVRFWDKAASVDGDQTAGVLMARSAEGLFYVEDVVCGRWSPGERDAVILQTAQLDRERGNVSIVVEQEPGSGGKDSALASVRLLAGFDVRAERASGDKSTRAGPLAAQAEAGNVRLVRGRWNGPYLDELTQFPMGKHDDQVDASSGAFNRLAPLQTRFY